MKSIEIIVFGRVQGVCYRAFTMQQAEKLGIKGYAKNLVNGNVKVIAVGDHDQLNSFIEKLKVGPALAHVDDLQISDIVAGETFNNFRIRY